MAEARIVRRPGEQFLAGEPDNLTSAAAHRALGFREAGLVVCFRKELQDESNQQAAPADGEPVSEFTVHVDNGQLAFVRADATLMGDGRAQSHNIDDVTLIYQHGTWKIVSASYTTTPLGS